MSSNITFMKVMYILANVILPQDQAESSIGRVSFLRANVNMHQTNNGKSPKICFHTYFHILQLNMSLQLWCSFLFVKIYFSFREIIFFVRPLKYANFHREYHPSCVTSCNEFTWPQIVVSVAA